MSHKKKVNPRRIPLAKSEIDKSSIMSAATENDMYRAWLLILCAMADQEWIDLESIPEIVAEADRYIMRAHPDKSALKEEFRRAEKLMGIPMPYENLNIDSVRSPIELEAFKNKVFKMATHTALTVIFLGLESSGRFSEEQLRRIFFHVDLSLAEIDSGISSYGDFETKLDRLGLSITERDADSHFIRRYNLCQDS